MGLGFKEFEVGEVLGAADVMGYLMKQSVMAFTSKAALLAGVDTPEEGMLAYTRDDDVYWWHTGTAWEELWMPGAWYSYTPAWTSSGTQPGIGNGTRHGRYKREGRTVTFIAEINMGSTTTYGSGAYSLSLPVNARTDSPTQFVHSRASDASGGQAWGGQSGAVLESTVPIQVQTSSGNLDGVTATHPFTFASGDALRAFGTYEMAVS